MRWHDDWLHALWTRWDRNTMDRVRNMSRRFIIVFGRLAVFKLHVHFQDPFQPVITCENPRSTKNKYEWSRSGSWVIPVIVEYEWIWSLISFRVHVRQKPRRQRWREKGRPDYDREYHRTVQCKCSWIQITHKSDIWTGLHYGENSQKQRNEEVHKTFNHWQNVEFSLQKMSTICWKMMSEWLINVIAGDAQLPRLDRPRIARPRTC